MTAEEVAPFLGLGRTATYAAIRNGEIPTVRFGTRVRVPTAALWRLFGLDPDLGATEEPAVEAEASP